MIGQQAIIDAYLCLLHLTAGILVGKCYWDHYKGLPERWAHECVCLYVVLGAGGAEWLEKEYHEFIPLPSTSWKSCLQPYICILGAINTFFAVCLWSLACEVIINRHPLLSIMICSQLLTLSTSITILVLHLPMGQSIQVACILFTCKGMKTLDGLEKAIHGIANKPY